MPLATVIVKNATPGVGADTGGVWYVDSNGIMQTSSGHTWDETTGLALAKKLTVTLTSAQFSARYDASNYATIDVNSVGRLKILASGNAIVLGNNSAGDEYWDGKVYCPVGRLSSPEDWGYIDGLFGAGNSTSTGQNVILIGRGSGAALTSGASSVTLGSLALAACTEGASHIAIGYRTLWYITTQSHDVAIGANAGSFESGGGAASAVSQGVFIGSDARSNASTSTNEIVIGYAARGAGSNTTMMGNSSITKNVRYASDELRYDASNYLTISVSSAGVATFNCTAGSGTPYVVFSDHARFDYGASHDSEVVDTLAADAVTIDFSTGNMHYLDYSGQSSAATITLVATTGSASAVNIRIKCGGAGATTWTPPGGDTIIWSGGTAPDLSTANVFKLIGFRYDGTYWLGFVSNTFTIP